MFTPRRRFLWTALVLIGFAHAPRAASGQAAAFRHAVTQNNLVENGRGTVVDHPLANRNEKALLFVSAVQGKWNFMERIPQSVVVDYDPDLRRWLIVTEHQARLRSGTQFCVLVLTAGRSAFQARQPALQNSEDVGLQRGMFLDHPIANEKPDATLFVTRLRPQDHPPNPQPFQLEYLEASKRWSIASATDALGKNGGISPGDGFNVLVVNRGDSQIDGIRIHSCKHGFNMTTKEMRAPARIGSGNVRLGLGANPGLCVFTSFRTPRTPEQTANNKLTGLLYNDRWYLFQHGQSKMDDGILYNVVAFEPNAGAAGKPSATAKFKGSYERRPVENEYHQGDIADDPNREGRYLWTNKAGVSWTLATDASRPILRKEPTSPYFDSPLGKHFELTYDSNGLVYGFHFDGEFYTRTR